METIAKLGRGGLGVLERLGRALLFLLRTIKVMPATVLKPGLLVKQLHFVGVLTLLIIIVSGVFVGMVLGLTGYSILVRFNSESVLGSMVGVGLVRELGPVITALLFAGRAGSALTAEIGLMKTTEQLSAMEMMAIDPFKRIFAPRLMAGFISMPILAAVFSAVGVYGGYYVGVGLLGVDAGAYWAQMQDTVDFQGDVTNGIIKSIVFGFVTTWIAIYEGYESAPTAEGISRATTRSVVNASLVVLGLNFILTSLMLDGD